VRGRSLVLLALLLATPCAPASAGPEAAPSGVRIVEFVTDPQTDWNGDGKITASDEYIELLNEADESVSLEGWTLRLNDSSPSTALLGGWIEARARLVVWDPPGSLNNDGRLELRDAQAALVHVVAFGTADPSGRNPNGNAQSVSDEALRWAADGWQKGHATPGAANGDAFVLAHWASGTQAPRFVAAHQSHEVRLDVRWSGRTMASVGFEGQASKNVSAADRWVGIGSWTAPSNGTTSVVAIITDTSGAVAKQTLGSTIVDATGPSTPMLAPRVWTNASSVLVKWPPSLDEGVGGVHYLVEASQANASWSQNVTAPEVRIDNISRDRPWVLHVTALDALGNPSNETASTRVEFDDQPPSMPSALRVQGSPTTTVYWSASTDDGSGVAAYEVQRSWRGETRILAQTNATAWMDADAPKTGPLAYRVRSLDNAGNPSAWAIVEADHDALYPQLLGVRVKKALWSTGVQDIWLDFDRRMNVSAPTRVTLAGRDIEGSWLGNASTYKVRLPDPLAWPQGHLSMVVHAARDAYGTPLKVATAPGFTIDTQAPVASWDPARLVISVRDDVDPNPRLWIKLWSTTQSAPAEYQAGVPDRPFAPGNGDWRLRFYAQDAAGHAERVTEVRFVLGAPPAAPESTGSAAEAPRPAAIAVPPRAAWDEPMPPAAPEGQASLGWIAALVSAIAAAVGWTRPLWIVGWRRLRRVSSLSLARRLRLIKGRA
jgi:hypothetical protein